MGWVPGFWVAPAEALKQLLLLLQMEGPPRQTGRETGNGTQPVLQACARLPLWLAARQRRPFPSRKSKMQPASRVACTIAPPTSLVLPARSVAASAPSSSHSPILCCSDGRQDVDSDRARESAQTEDNGRRSSRLAAMGESQVDAGAVRGLAPFPVGRSRGQQGGADAATRGGRALAKTGKKGGSLPLPDAGTPPMFPLGKQAKRRGGSQVGSANAASPCGRPASSIGRLDAAVCLALAIDQSVVWPLFDIHRRMSRRSWPTGR
ncbi:uncharacterized protein PSFLO_02383 [Pseudozyma flocculosa]|uniref:Uncharacterized protein n=1 Tax=Pseudozyma flocculosa TaxID=84751 RepID=A0A5C3EXU3_9BASI|nr:uncharacterized protein PSFLO_02383 [Pseudozyma flocculosa]